MLKTETDQSVFQSERGEAEIWEAFKSKYSPGMHSEIKEIVCDRYNGDVKQFAKDWMAILISEE